MTSRKQKAGRLASITLVLLFASGERPDGPAPRFTGKAIPDPPGQRERWTPPDTKLPRFLVDASVALFEAGMADPRGCAYRDVELGDFNLIKTRGFVLPATAGETGRFAIGWDGVVYPLFAPAQRRTSRRTCALSSTPLTRQSARPRRRMRVGSG